MKKYIVVISISLVLLVSADFLFFRSFYNLQVNNQKNILFKQVELCSNEIIRVVQRFESDLNHIVYTEDINTIFSESSEAGIRKLELFYSTYFNLIDNIDIYDNNKNVLNLYRNQKKRFINDRYIAQRQRKLSHIDDVITQDNQYQYIIPVFHNNQLFANVLVTVNLEKYLLSELNKFYVEDLTWQWIIDLKSDKCFNTRAVLYDNFERRDEIVSNLNKDLNGMLIHHVSNDTLDSKLLSVYAPIKVLNRKFGIAFSVDYQSFMSKVLNNFIIVAIVSALIFVLLSLYFFRQIRLLKKKIKA